MKQISPHVHLLGIRHVRLFLVGREKAALVECGTSAAVECLKSRISTLAKEPAVCYLAATHAHFDHVCGIPALRELFPEARVIASQTAAAVLSKPSVVKGFFEEDEKMSETLFQMKVLSALPEILAVEAIGVDRVVREGDVIRLDDGLALHTIESPGHSPCSLSFYLPEDRVMFLSDSGGLRVSDKKMFPLFFYHCGKYFESLEKLKTYDIQVLALPHEAEKTGAEVPAYFDEAIRSANDFIEQVQDCAKNNENEDELIRLFFDRYYHERLRIFKPEYIIFCIRLLIRRAKEYLGYPV